MVGYLRVKPDLRLLGSLWVFGSLLALALVSLRTQATPPSPPGNGQPAAKETTP
jgi:hypothetical protein